MRLVFVLSILLLSCSNLCFGQFLGIGKKKEIKFTDKTSVVKPGNRLLLSIELPEGSNTEWASLFFTLTGRITLLYGTKDYKSEIFRYTSDITYKNWTLSKASTYIPTSVKSTLGMFVSISGRYSYPIFMFYKDSILRYNIKESNRNEWLTKRMVNNSLSPQDEVIGIIKNGYDLTLLLNTSDNVGNKSVLSVISKDNGINWELPTITIKHNQVSLEGRSIFSKRDGSSYYMLLSNNQAHPYVSQSSDGGDKWSYPKLLSDEISGTNYKIYVRRTNAAIFYQRKDDNSLADKNGDIVMWNGAIKDLLNESIGKGNFSVVVDNNKDISDINLLDIIYAGRGRYILAYTYKRDKSEILRVHMVKK